MTKSQLQPGHIIECRNGFRAMLLQNNEFAADTTVLHNARLNEDLTSVDQSYDVVKVYVPTLWFTFSQLVYDTTEHLQLVWERQEFEYPIYCKYDLLPHRLLIVRFDSLNSGTVVASRDVPEFPEGYASERFISHTNHKWTQVEAPVTSTQPTLEEICEALGITIIGDFDPVIKQSITNTLLELFEE
jgi:uncharacterized surface protein with fasciclin (FAS1) repeats